MEFRPCIDIHNGSVKQIVGGSLADKDDFAEANFISEKGAEFFAQMYKGDNLKGGHIVILNSRDSLYYESSINQAKKALLAFPGGLQIGGGINDKNASEFLEAGASHVIVTSFVFKNGELNFNNLEKLVDITGKEKLVLDLSCRKKENDYFIVTDRWQKFTQMKLDNKILDELSGYCNEFLIHAVDVEGKSAGIDNNIISILAQHKKLPVTYAGGVSCIEELERLRGISDNINVTIGSSLDIFGGKLSYNKVVEFCKKNI